MTHEEMRCRGGHACRNGADSSAKSGRSRSRRPQENGACGLFLSRAIGPVQPRNSAGFGTADGKLVQAGLVDTSGYAADVQARYQGFLITAVKLNIGGSELNPGQYGFRFSKEGKFLEMDVGDNDLFTAAGAVDDKQAHPVPLKIVQEGDSYRLYAGRKWVGLKTR